jgi:hypothetical protein
MISLFGVGFMGREFTAGPNGKIAGNHKLLGRNSPLAETGPGKDRICSIKTGFSADEACGRFYDERKLSNNLMNSYKAGLRSGANFATCQPSPARAAPRNSCVVRFCRAEFLEEAARCRREIWLHG